MKLNVTDIITNDIRDGSCYFVYDIKDEDIYVQKVGKTGDPIEKFIWNGEFVVLANIIGEYDSRVIRPAPKDRVTSVTNYTLKPIDESKD